ncbi:MAG TPA: signal peptide peptidase SppA [Oligoflexia bacterium]|nr:signal peptide peptidase SppA [Oligoflexia bacterium]HMP48755.1 signal peptide peptidase SppA [Oligoflexia bacterium]
MKEFLKSVFAAVGFITIAITILFVVLMVVIVRNIGDSPMGSSLGAISDSGASVGVVELEGEIITSRDFREKIERFVENKNIKGIVVRIDSPGGAVGASEEIYRYILQAREKKPVVCSLGNTAASGGLYSSLGCSKVYTSAGTLTGSIGVILMMPNFSDIMGKVGFKFNVVKTGALKDAGSPFREFTDEDRTYLQGVAMEAYDQFVTAVSQSRNIPIEKVKEFADGRIILGSQAVSLGLADAIGGLEDAARDVLAQAIGEGHGKEPKLVFPPKKLNVPDFLKSINDGGAMSVVPDKYKTMSIRYQMM